MQVDAMFKSVPRCTVLLLVTCFSLVFVVQKTSCSALVSYVLGSHAENCTTACDAHGKSCIERSAFPRDSLNIFHLLNVNCSTDSYTDSYVYPDQPNFITLGQWKGRCTGFKERSSDAKTNCDQGGNPSVRRLCPCRGNTTEPTAVTVISSLATNATTAISTTPTTSQKTTSQTPSPTTISTVSLGSKASANITHGRRSRNYDGTPFSTLEIILVVLVILLVLAMTTGFIFVYKRRSNNRKKQKSPSTTVSAHSQMRKNSQRQVQNNAYMETMVDVDSTRIRSTSTDYLFGDQVFNSSSLDTIEENACYESIEDLTAQKNRSESLNVLYEQNDDTTQRPTSSTTTRKSDNPIYGSGGTEYDPVVFFAIPEYGPVYDSIDKEEIVS